MKSQNPFFQAIVKTAMFTLLVFLFPVNSTAQLSGTYTIDPAGAAFDPGGTPFPNFKTFAEAVDTLHSQGVVGPVVINVADGTYTEKIQINSIGGASASNRITFQSASLDSTKVILKFECTASTNIWTLRLNGTGFVTIRKMRIQGDGNPYGRVININGTANNNIIEHCQLMAPGVTSGSSELIWSGNDETNNITIRNNLFLNGSRGIDMEGIGTGQLGTGLQVYGNTFIDQGYFGILVDVYDAPKIYNNNITMSGGTGISVEFCFNDTEVRNNVIKMDKTTGININRCQGNALFKCLISNNFIWMGGQGETGIRSYISEFVNIYHNSVLVTNSNTQNHICAYWLDDYSPTGYSSDIDLRNNNFANYGGGPAVNIESNWAITSDYNNFYVAGDKLAAWSGDHSDLESLQNTTLKDANSVSVDPRFLGTDDLHSDSYWLNGAGDATLGINTDIDGDTRLSPPDIGADEFDPVTPLSGTYSIGGTDPDYLTVKAAMDDLESMGVIGPTTFKIRDGNYVEYIGRIRPIPGASATDSIVLTSETGSRKNVSILYENDNTDQNIFHLIGVDHFTLSNLTIKSTDDIYGRPLYIGGNIENLNLLDCEFSLVHPNDWAVVAIVTGTSDDVVIKGNKFSGGGRGITFAGDDVNWATNSVVENNEFTGASVHGMKMSYQISPKIIKNKISNADNAVENYAGMDLVSCKQAMQIIGNNITLTKAKNGIYMSNCIAVDPYRALIANNMIKAGDKAATYGIQVRYSERQNFYHNSVHLTSTDTTNGRGIYINEDNSEINIVNNILANSGGGYALYVEDPTDVQMSDYNALYVVGDSLASWGGTAYSDLASLNSSTGMDGHSVPDEPMFESSTDLHTNQLAYEEAGTALSEVPFDFDDNPRDPQNPDIGASEFYCETPDFNVFVSTGCLGDSTIFIDSSTNITEGATYGWDFDGDFNPEYISRTPLEKVIHFFESSGSHAVNFSVSQLGGCDDFITLSAEVIAAPILEITTQGAYCDTADGSASITINNIPGPFKYYWSDADGKRLDQTDSTATGLGIGRYNVTVSDQNGCTSDTSVVIGEAIIVTVTATKTSNCGVADGAATVSASGGVEPYRFVWSNGDTTATNSRLAPGSHYVNVIDKNGCYAQGSVDIKSVGGPQITLEKQVNNECFAKRSGSLEISVSGGASPYSVLWSNGETTMDIDSLYAGIYNVRVKDSDGCVGAGSFQIHQPSQISISPVVTPATCKGSDGTAVAVTGGGTKPYIYEWSTGGIFQIEEGLAAGVYSVTATDSKGCKMVQPVIVNDIGAPEVTIDNVTGVGCKTTDNGAIDISVSPGSPFYSYSWSSGQITADISGLTVGTYEVTVTDQNGCKGFATTEVGQDPPQVNPICLVTVDTSSGRNLVVWEKSVTTDVSHYNIYRESSVRNDFQLLASFPVDELSEFTDSVADPTVRSWRYRMSVVDECGNESEMSPVHKTIHLTMNLGLVDNTVNLLWDRYEGFPVPTYKILRAVSDLPITSVTDLPSTSSSYTDDVTALGDDLYYFVEVRAPGDGCTSEDRKAATLNNTRSNRKTKLKSTTSIKDHLDITNLTIYPNPSQGIFNLSMDLGSDETVKMKVFNSTGQLVMIKEFVNQYHSLDTQIDLSGQSSGIYHIHIRTDKAIIHRILIME